MAGFADGFAQGFGLMENSIARRDQREYRDTRAGLEDERYLKNQTRLDNSEIENKRRYKDSQERLNAGETRQAGIDTQNANLNAARIAASESQVKASESQAKSFDLQQQQLQMQIKTGQESAANQAAVKALQMWNLNGTATPEQQQAISEAGINMTAMRDPKFAQYHQTLDGVMANKVHPNSPEAMTAFNVLMSDQIERGIGQPSTQAEGAKIVSQRIVSGQFGDGKLFPKDHIAFQVESTDDQGNVWQSGLTVNRSTDPNDPVKTVPIDDLMQHLIGMRKLADEPLIKQALSAMTPSEGTWSTPNNGTSINSKTGEFRQDPNYQAKPMIQQEEKDGEKYNIQSYDNGKTWRRVGTGAPGQQGRASWGDMVNTIAQQNGVTPAEAERKMMADKNLQALAPPQPLFASAGTKATAEQLKTKPVPEMGLAERLEHEELNDQNRKAKANESTRRREHKQRLAQIERALTQSKPRDARNWGLGGAGKVQPIDPGQQQLMRQELELMFENPDSSEKDKKQIVKLIKQLR